MPAQSSKNASWIQSWMSSPEGSSNYAFLDGLRGIAILMVLVCHSFYFNPEGGLLQRWIGKMCGYGSTGVALFFALSGFLIAIPFWKLKAKDSPHVVPPGYFTRRWFKIYPPLALSFVILFPLYCYFQNIETALYLKTVLQWLTGATLFFPVASFLNPVTWTLIIEGQFYLSIPLVFLLFRKVSFKKAVWGIPLFLLGIAQIASFIYATYGLTPQLHPVILTLFPVGLQHFALGVLIAGLHVQKAIPVKASRWADRALFALGPTVMILAFISTEVKIPSGKYRGSFESFTPHSCSIL